MGGGSIYWGILDQVGSPFNACPELPVPIYPRPEFGRTSHDRQRFNNVWTISWFIQNGICLRGVVKQRLDRKLSQGTSR